jgi:hypothetical protein
VHAKPFDGAQAAGMVRSLMIHITMCMDSGISEMKSQNVSWAEAACGKPRSGSIFTAYQVGKLHRILDEEHRHVVPDQIPVAFVGIELDGETTHVARSVHGASAAGHGGKAHEDGYLSARFGQHLGRGVFGQGLLNSK